MVQTQRREEQGAEEEEENEEEETKKEEVIFWLQLKLWIGYSFRFCKIRNEPQQRARNGTEALTRRGAEYSVFLCGRRRDNGAEERLHNWSPSE